MIYIIGMFQNFTYFKQAIQQLNNKKNLSFEIYTLYPIPKDLYPIHTAQPNRSFHRVYGVAFFAGFLACILSFIFQYWTTVIDWPMQIGGKPIRAWPTWIPVAFECSLLWMGLVCVSAFLYWTKPSQIEKKIAQLTDIHRPWILMIPVFLQQMPEKTESETRELSHLLITLGAKKVHLITEEGIS